MLPQIKLVALFIYQKKKKNEKYDFKIDSKKWKSQVQTGMCIYDRISVYM